MKIDHLCNEEFKQDIVAYKSALDAASDLKAFTKKLSNTLEFVKNSGISPNISPPELVGDSINQKYQKAKAKASELMEEFSREWAMTNTLKEEISDLEKELIKAVKAERKKLVMDLLTATILVVVLWLLYINNNL